MSKWDALIAAVIFFCLGALAASTWHNAPPRPETKAELLTVPRVEHVHEHAEHHAEPRSGKWPKVRAEYLAGHPACEFCGEPDGPMQIHHQRPFHLYPELELDPGNLITLCPHCHFAFGHSRNFKAFNPHIREDAALMQQRREGRGE